MRVTLTEDLWIYADDTLATPSVKFRDSGKGAPGAVVPTPKVVLPKGTVLDVTWLVRGCRGCATPLASPGHSHAQDAVEGGA